VNKEHKKNKSVNLSFRCTEDTSNKLEKWADEEGRSLSNYLNRIAEKHVEDKTKGGE